MHSSLLQAKRKKNNFYLFKTKVFACQQIKLFKTQKTKTIKQSIKVPCNEVSQKVTFHILSDRVSAYNCCLLSRGGNLLSALMHMNNSAQLFGQKNVSLFKEVHGDWILNFKIFEK